MWKFFCAFLCVLLFQSSYSQAIQAGGPTTFCEGGSVRLTLNGVSGSRTYQWTRDGNNITGATNNAYTATISGSYNVIITPSPGTISPVPVTVNPKPILDFTFPTGACAGTPIQFTSTVTSGTAPFTYAWNFGDGGTSNQQNPSHSFASFGCGSQTYTVRLTVTDDKGCTNTLTKSITVKQVPNIDMTDQANPFSPFNNCNNSPTAGNASFKVQLAFNTPSSSCATSYAVNWGDGNTQNALTPASFPLTHTYTQLGTYELTVTTTGSNGCTYSKVYKVVNQSNPAVGIEAPGSTTGCAPSGFPFKLKGYELNSPGTTYTWDFDDGTPLQTWTTPVSSETIFHLFSATSCTKPKGEYVVKVTAENGCKATTATVDNITIYTKPKADFATPGSGCVNRPLTFSNTTIAGYNQGCNRTTRYVWDFGDGTPTVSATSNTAQSHTYTTTGTFTVTLIAEGSCGKDTVTKPICVVATPTASFDLDKTDACGPSTITATNTSSTINGCSSATYQWTVTYTAGNCGTTAGWSFANSTTASSVHPAFTFTNPGTYAIRLSTVTGCGTITATKTVVIKAPPRVSIAAISNACGPVTLSPTASVTNCGSNPPSYSWVIDGVSPITTPNPGSLTFTTPGTHTITLTVENECGSASATRSFTISAPPSINSSSNKVYCPGTAVSAHNFAGTTAGATYSWSNTNTTIGLGSGGTSSTVPAFTAANPGTATITLRATLNGCTAVETYTITVSPRPAPPTTSPQSYCLGMTAVPLTATGLAGNTLTWYTSASGGTGTTTAPVPSTTAVGTTTYYVSQSNPTTGCESTRAPLTVTVSAIPTVNNATFTSPTSCTTTNGTITLTGLSPSTSYTVSYTFNGLATTRTIVSNSSGNIVMTSLASGLYDQIKVTRNGCSSTPAGPFTLMDPNPPATPVIASNNSPICSGSTLTLSASGSPAGATYSWTTPSGSTVAGATLTTTNAQVSAAGTYSVKAVLNGCSSTSATTTVSINPTPAQPTANSNGPLCTGGALNLTAASATPGVNYAWTGPNNFTSNLQNPSISSVTSAANGTYNVVAISTQGSCTSASRSVSVVVSTPPVVTVAVTQPSSCTSSNGSLVISNLASTGAHMVQYTKDGVAVTPFSRTPTNGTITISNLGAGVYSGITVSMNGCTSAPAGPFTISDPNPPITPTITSNNSPLCSGGTLVLTASNAPSGATYSWTTPSGSTLTGPTLTINNVQTSASGTYSVRATLNGCNSTPATTTVLVNPSPVQPTIVTNSPVCEGATVNLSANSNTSGVAYSWSGPNGFTSTLQSPTIPNATPAASGNYTVTARVNGCSSAPGQVSVLVNPVPQAPAVKPAAYCIGDVAEALTATPLAGNSLNWYTDPTGGTAITTAPVPSTTTAGTKTYYVSQLTAQGCESPRSQLQVVVSPTPIISASSYTDPSNCSPNNGTITLDGFAANTMYAVSYRKNGNLVSTTLQSGSTGSIVIGSLTAGTYSDLAVGLGGCSSPVAGPFTLRESVTAPAVPKASIGSMPCTGGSLALLANSTTPGITYHWSGPNGFTSNEQNPTLSSITTAASGKYYVWVQLNACVSEKDSVTVVVGTGVTAPPAGGSLVYCEGQAVTPLTAVASPGNTLLWYNTSNGGTGSITAPTPQTSLAGTVTYYVSQKSSQGCESNRIAIVVTVNAKPKTNILSETARCQNDNVLFTSNVQSQDPVHTLQWNFSNGATTTGPSASYRFTSPGTYTVQLKATTAKGCSDSAVHTIQIQPAPILVSSQDINLCQGQSAQLNVQGAASYQWTPINALSCATCPTPTVTPSSSTTYVVEGRNAAGCRAYDTVKIMVAKPFKVSVSPNDSICAGSSVNLLATGASLYQWSPAQGLDNTTISNPVSRPTATTSYTVVGYDQYNCFTDTARVLIAVGPQPSVNLGPDLTLASGTMHPLNATITNGPIRGWTWSPATNLSCTSCPRPVAEIKKDISYTVSVETPYGCIASDTVSIKVVCNAGQVFIPNAFTPDGDGINDILMVRASGITSVKYFRIFNRWGELIFERNNFLPNNIQHGWDGKIRGVVGGPDVFVYTCEVICENGSAFTYKGNVSIIK